MWKSMVQQPMGQKRLTNVAVVRLKKRGLRLEIACYKNKVLSWRRGVEKDLNEVLQSDTIYSNVSKGVLAKWTDLKDAFGKDEQHDMLMEILVRGDLQVARMEREYQFSNRFRDIATIVMQKTYNPENQRPYSISMIEKLMHEIHFAVDPLQNSKKQALEVIRELQKHFPIKRSPMRLRLAVPEKYLLLLMEKLNVWSASIISKDESGILPSLVCELEPGIFRDCDVLVRNMQGRLEVLALSIHMEGDARIYHYDDIEDHPVRSANGSDDVAQVTKIARKQRLPSESANGEMQAKQNRCSTCDAVIGDTKQYREHFKSEWHKHNLKRKTKQRPPLSAEEWITDMLMCNSRDDLKDYSF